LVHEAVGLPERRASVPHQESFQRIPAFLVIDSFAEGRLLGLRRTGPLTRQMLYRASGYEIDLSVDWVADSELVDLIGQVIPVADDLAPVAPAEVELLNGGPPALAASMNEFGEFMFESVPEGVYDLRIKLNAEVIEISKLQASWDRR
jgi:hypothetical protein